MGWTIFYEDFAIVPYYINGESNHVILTPAGETIGTCKSYGDATKMIENYIKEGKK